MTRRTSPADPDALSPRQLAVLQQIVRQHVASGQPVGSAAVARAARVDLCSASVRRVMGELEDRGLLTQPHTSAGRVPTDRGYRVYVDQVLERPARISPAQAGEIDRALGRSRGELPDLLEQASRLLSRESHHVGLVLAPELGRIALERVEFVPIDPRRVAAVLVGRSGVVHNRVLGLDAPMSPEELERSGRYLSEEYRGLTLPAILEALRRRQREERATADRLLTLSLDLCQRAAAADLDEAAVFVEGAANLLESPEFADVDAVRTLFRTLEEKERLIGLLGRLLDGQGVQVVIGEENPLEGLARCAVVARSYGVGSDKLGTVGVVGPRRMPYSRVIALVDHLARALTGYLSDREN